MFLGTLEKADEIIRACENVYARYDAESFVGDVEELAYCRTTQQKEKIRQQLLKQLRKDPHNPDLLYKVATITGDLGDKIIMYRYLKKALECGHAYANVTWLWRRLPLSKEALQKLLKDGLISNLSPNNYRDYPLQAYRTQQSNLHAAFNRNVFNNILVFNPTDEQVDRCTYIRTLKGASLISKEQAHWLLEAKEFAPTQDLKEGLVLLESAARAGRADALCNLGQYWWCQGLLHNKQAYFDCALKYLTAAIKYSPRALFALYCVYSPSKPGPQHLKDQNKANLFLLYIGLSDDVMVKVVFAKYRKHTNSGNYIIHSQYSKMLIDQNEQEFVDLLQKDPAIVLGWLQPHTDVAPGIQETLRSLCYQLLHKVLPFFKTAENEHILELRRLLAMQHADQGILPESPQFFAQFTAQQLLMLGNHFLTAHQWPKAEEKLATDSKNENSFQREQEQFQAELLELMIRCYLPKGIQAPEDKAYVDEDLKPEARAIVRYIYETQGQADLEKFWPFLKGFLYYAIPVAKYEAYSFQDFVRNPPVQLPELWQKLTQLIMRIRQAVKIDSLNATVFPAAKNEKSTSTTASFEFKSQVSQSTGTSLSTSAPGSMAVPKTGVVATLALEATFSVMAGPDVADQKAEVKSETGKKLLDTTEIVVAANQKRREKVSGLVFQWSPIFSRVPCESFVQRHPCLYGPVKSLLVFQCLSMIPSECRLPQPLILLALEYVWEDGAPEEKVVGSDENATQVSRHSMLALSK